MKFLSALIREGGIRCQLHEGVPMCKELAAGSLRICEVTTIISVEVEVSRALREENVHIGA